METEWMGRYREFVAELVRHSNLSAKNQYERHAIADEVETTAAEWQILEYVVEHWRERAHMSAISNALGIPQSTFSKGVKSLCGYGLLEKYMSADNRKNIILLPTERGTEVYRAYAAELEQAVFRSFFDSMETVSDEDLKAMTNALRQMNDRLTPDTVREPELHKV